MKMQEDAPAREKGKERIRPTGLEGTERCAKKRENGVAGLPGGWPGRRPSPRRTRSQVSATDNRRWNSEAEITAIVKVRDQKGEPFEKRKEIPGA